MRSGLIVSATVGILLAGCATPAPEPTAEPSTPTPTPTVEAQPGPRLPIGCDDLVPASALATALGTAVAATELSGLATGPVAAATAGVTACRWGDVGLTPGLRLTVTVDPADVAAYDARAPQGFENPTVASAAIGDESVVACESFAGSNSCYFSVRDDSAWMAGAATLAGSGSAEDAAARLAALVTEAFGTVAAAEPLPAWTPPAKLAVDPADCSWLAAGGTVGTAVGGGADAFVDGPSGPPEDALAGVWSARIGAASCTVDPGFEVQVLPGAAWAWDDAIAGWTSATVTGADAAASTCATSDGREYCSVRVLVGDSIVEGRFGGSNALAVATAGAAAVIPLLPIEPAA